ncbi:probable cytochrome P450 4p3 [Stomoxys calcitrans]|uniref:Cytochrome P450 n=1 Tax=Stomoxys calcitrans TaxID=35570 RepID=A0A1I8P0V5_STOCA|nr:probable cytochrome P450 4p3 [Stomoxys calcitrans]
MFLWTLAVGFVLILFIKRLHRDFHILAFFAPRIKTKDGSDVEKILPTVPGKTIFGNTFDTAGSDFVGTFKYIRDCAAQMKRSYALYVIGKTLVNVIDAEMAEMVFTNPKLITKGFVYDFLKPALGDGLLASSDRKWHARRKMLTPAFHFNILGQFQEVFQEESIKFVEKLNNMKMDVVVLDECIPKFTLNVICETALGVKLDECLNGDEYREKFCVFEECFNRRTNNPHLMIETIYKMFEEHKYLPALRIVHDFSSDIIKKKREIFAETLENGKEFHVEEDQVFSKKRYAMLDTLLRAEQEGLIDHEGICEEVDTFMFEGFDTTSMSLIFCLMNLSLHPEMQEQCYQEILEQTHNDLKGLDIAQLNGLKYLECFLKESMRLYTTVPAIMRETIEETHLPNGLILPPHTFITLHLFDLHRNPKHFKNPEVFDPNRFLPENSRDRHPYAFAPFSAGQRNCIGQKFAMLEMKTLLTHILKNFKILPLVDPKTFKFKSGIIIRPKNEVKVKFVKRQ